MINVKTLAENLEAGLNANTEGLVYTIFADAGKYKKRLKTRKDNLPYVNGLLQIVSSSVMPVQTLYVATMNANLEICVALPNAEQDEQIISVNRRALDSFFNKSTVQILSDDAGNIFSVSVNYSLSNTGSIEFRDGVGTSVTFGANINYSFIENGLNSFNCTFELDGVQLPYINASIARIPVMESNPYDGEGSSKNMPIASTLSFDFKLTATIDENAATNAIFDSLLSGALGAEHTLKINLRGLIKSYAVIFGQTDLSLDGIQNAGHPISLVEALPQRRESNG